MHAAMDNRKDILNTLLSKGADVNAIDQYYLVDTIDRIILLTCMLLHGVIQTLSIRCLKRVRMLMRKKGKLLCLILKSRKDCPRVGF